MKSQVLNSFSKILGARCTTKSIIVLDCFKNDGVHAIYYVTAPEGSRAAPPNQVC